MVKQYPLEALRRLRAEQVEKKARDLGTAESLCAATNAALDECKRRQAQLETECAQISDGEQARLEGGQASVADLARAAAWATDVAVQDAARRAEVASAEQALEHSRAEVELERVRLAKARADADVVERDLERWRQRNAAALLRAEEEEAQEVHQARSHVRRGP